jgi:hypothetical protein
MLNGSGLGSSSWESVISNGDNIKYPSKFHLGFHPGENDSQTTFQLPNPLDVQNMVTEDGGTRGFGTGVTTSNFTNIQHGVVQRFSKRFSKDTCHTGMLSFINRSGKSLILRLKTDYEIAVIHELNAFLYSPEGRQEYGTQKTAEKLIDDYAFAGVYAAEIAGYKSNSEMHVANIITGRRARCAGITRAFRHKKDMTADHVLHNVYLLAIRRKEDRTLDRTKTDTNKKARMASSKRFKMKSIHSSKILDTTDADQAIGIQVGGASGGDNDQSYYWGFNLFMTDSDAGPPPYLYCDDESIGYAKRVGYVLQHSGDSKVREDHVLRARRSLSGKHNEGCEPGSQERSYLQDVPLLPYVDIAIAM